MSYMAQVKKAKVQNDPVKHLTHQAQQQQQMMSRILSDAYVLLTRAQNVHWNFQGASFFGLHKMTEKLYKQQLDFIDDLAERIRAKGAIVPVNLSDFETHSCLKGEVSEQFTDRMVAQLISDFSLCCKQLYRGIEACENAKDPATCDLLTQMVTHYEHAAWQLRSMM